MRVPVFDGHNDTLIASDVARFVAGRDGGHVDLPRMRAGGMRGGIFAVYTPSAGGRDERTAVPRDDGVLELELPPEEPHERAAAWVAAGAGRLLAWERAGLVRVARVAADLDAVGLSLEGDGDDPVGGGGDGDGGGGGGGGAGDGGGGAGGGTPPVAVLHFEGAEAVDTGFEALETWYAAGLRSLGLVWSRPNRFGHGVPFVFPSSPDTGPGLTEFGMALVKRCASLGILVDLAHLNEAGFWDVARLDVGPLVVSHAGVHSLSAASRNLVDAQLDAIGASGGLVGIVFAAPFLRADFEDSVDTPVALIAEHARYVADRIGVEHVALGSDFDGATIPAGVGGADGLPVVLDALRDVGFTPAEVEAIAWRNWRRVLAAWWRG